VDAAAELESAVLDADELDTVELDSGELDAVAVLDPLGAGEGWLSAAVAGPMTTRTVTSAAVMAKAVRGYRPIRTLTTPSWLVSPTTRGADRPPGINHICLINAPEQPIRGRDHNACRQNDVASLFNRRSFDRRMIVKVPPAWVPDPSR
jgi:hypothetical protein